jgi:hypothetical protein
VLWNNIQDSKKDQYERLTEYQGENLPYNYLSIMHYGHDFFVKDKKVGPAMRMKDKCYQVSCDLAAIEDLQPSTALLGGHENKVTAIR